LASYLAGEPTDSNDIEPVIAGSGFVRASRGRDAVEQRREHDADGKIERERVERRVARDGEAIDLQREHGRLEMGGCSHPRPSEKAGCPADEQRARIEPARVEANDNGRDRLADPNSSEELQLDGVFDRQEDDEDERAKLDDQRYDLGVLRLLLGGAISIDEAHVDVAREQVRRSDRHDRSRDEPADPDRCKGDARKPVWK